jgi:four helix bundle protein
VVLDFMNKDDLKQRLKLLAIETARLCVSLPVNLVNRVYCEQVIRSSSSSAANYRSACRAKSRKDFINKLGTVEEELDETMFFYEMIAEFNESVKLKLRVLYKEADELLSIIIASINTAASNLQKDEEKRKAAKKSAIRNHQSAIK